MGGPGVHRLPSHGLLLYGWGRDGRREGEVANALSRSPCPRVQLFTLVSVILRQCATTTAGVLQTAPGQFPPRVSLLMGQERVVRPL